MTLSLISLRVSQNVSPNRDKMSHLVNLSYSAILIYFQNLY